MNEQIEMAKNDVETFCDNIINKYKDTNSEIYKKGHPHMRLINYIKDIILHGEYDYDLKKKVLNQEVSTELENKMMLQNFCNNKKGVCKQFAEILCLICSKDPDIECERVQVTLLQNNELINHAINKCTIKNESVLVDLSTCIHWYKENEFKNKFKTNFIDVNNKLSDVDDIFNTNFIFVKPQEYLSNIKKINYTLLSIGEVSYIKACKELISQDKFNIENILKTKQKNKTSDDRYYYTSIRLDDKYSNFSGQFDTLVNSNNELNKLPESVIKIYKTLKINNELNEKELIK